MPPREKPSYSCKAVSSGLMSDLAKAASKYRKAEEGFKKARVDLE